ncbi:DoxX family membrane protein [Streptomyces chlorus]|uniref:DoxX family membrane protein n=1 Tax=Streptomyces chlorus TaxID=887452 RepID=A0ABW1DZ79_9ACTN
MSSVTTSTTSAAPRRAVLTDPGYQAFVILRAGFTVAPILFGLDKFANLLVDWPTYLAPWIDNLVPGSAQATMYAVGAIEIVAGLAVALAPRFGSWLVAGWLAGIIVNLLTIPGHYDIALRDFGLLLGAVALARLAQRYHAKPRP